MLKGFCRTADLEANKIMYGFVHRFFDMESDKTYASQKIASSKMPNTVDSISNISARNTNIHEDRNVAHSISMRFKKRKTSPE